MFNDEMKKKLKESGFIEMKYSNGYHILGKKFAAATIHETLYQGSSETKNWVVKYYYTIEVHHTLYFGELDDAIESATSYLDDPDAWSPNEYLK